ncbi:reverse transcriptase domain-containing protein [Nephila pilipes]|uniref:Reverse transcriptase domain-containing protein n=2 Tax=Nephila pilipes TaxID=299642 RepID=A0A8X6NY58_NEPPI|nr:reverse transcriptase domain-containing protein [Nephila pilipes]
MFGVNVSPFLLSATIKHHIEKYREQYPAATEMLDTCLYVDDVISGADDISQALKISKDADTIMKDASMKLRKWNSNDQALMKTWEYEGLETYPRHSENDSGVQSSKVLGIPWNVIHDYFTIDVKGLLELDTSKPVTKRIVLQSAGKIYDPVGFLSPYTIKLKCLLQELWLRKLAWDDELPPDIYATWLQWRFIHNCRTRSAKIKGPLTSQEVSYAENWLIRSLHEKEFPEEMRKLLTEENSARIPTEIKTGKYEKETSKSSKTDYTASKHVSVEQNKIECTLSNHVNNGENKTLLETASVKLVGKLSSKVIRSLYDPGIQRSFIQKNLSRQLSLNKVGEEELLIHTFGSKVPTRIKCT